MSLLLFLVIATILISAICSLMEATLYSTRLATLESAKHDPRRRRAAARFIDLKRNISAPTAAILILNTVANTAGASYAGVQAAEVLDPVWMPLFSTLLTLGILFLSEIFPKTLGATRWRSLWPFISWPLHVTNKGLRPLVAVTVRVSRVFTRKAPPAVTTEDEILAMVRMGVESGQVSAQELKLLNNIFRFDDLRARHIMVPRRDVVTLQEGWSVAQCLEVVAKHRHTRYPLCRGPLERDLGLIHVKDLATVESPDATLQSLAHPLHRVPESLPLPALLKMMRARRAHMVFVVDEFGTVVGVVTLENVLEQIVGAVQDEFDAEEPDVVDEGDGRFVVRGLLPISELQARLDLRFEDPPEVDTLTGLVVQHLGRLPEVGDRVELRAGLHAEVLTVHADRAARLRLHVTPAEPEE